MRTPLAADEQARANIYALIAALLLAPPDDALRGALAQASLGRAFTTSPVGAAFARLADAARAADAQGLVDEYHALFVDVASPQVDPYASRYLAGFLMDAPLASLRRDLADLGIARNEGIAETEDHLGALCETMRVLIEGADGISSVPLDRQRAFFETHIASWQGACVTDIRNARGAHFYARVADFVDAFLAAEANAFALSA